MVFEPTSDNPKPDIVTISKRPARDSDEPCLRSPAAVSEKLNSIFE